MRRLTADNAALFGLHDRGLVRPGLKADLNVIDFDRLRLRRPEVAFDLPAGGRRLLQRADGYVATIVAGQVVMRDGTPTAARPGPRRPLVKGMPMSADGNATEAPLLIERDGAVETLVINDHPRNRMSLDFMDALEAEVARVADDPGVRAIVIRGAGTENFSVGMDLKQLAGGRQTERAA